MKNGLNKIDPKVKEGVSGLAATVAIMRAIKEQVTQQSIGESTVQLDDAQQSADEEPEL